VANAQKEANIYSFKGQTDGAQPYSALIADGAGNLYGTTSDGGGSPNCGKNVGCGTVYELTPPGNGVNHWTETVLYAFQGGTTDGFSPFTPLIFDTQGNLYGTTLNGGTSTTGVIFEVSPPAQSGGAWTETVLYNFANENPEGGLVFDSAGNLYGETNQQHVYELSPPAAPGATWIHTVLVQAASDSALYGGLVLDKDGDLYGTSITGGAGGKNCGFAFEAVKPATGGAWNEKVLYTFTGANGDACTPYGGVVFHGGNHLYGTSYAGGNFANGTVFELSPGAEGAPWTETSIYQFDHSTGASLPKAGVVFDKKGNLYSDAYFDQEDNGGEVFELSPPAEQGGSWTYTDLFDSNCDGDDGCYLAGGLTFDKGNVLYGTSSLGGARDFGVVFSVTP